MYYLVISGDETEYRECFSIKDARIKAKALAKRDYWKSAVIYKYTKGGMSPEPVETVRL